MNYIKLYETFCAYCRETDIIYRMSKRNKNDDRLLLDRADIYTEKHHILPISLGGSNDYSNLVELLPEEHYFAHLVRYKAFSCREDFIAIRLMLNGFLNKNSLKGHVNMYLISKRIGRYKQMCASFRKTVGWQTPDGRQRIAQSKKGKMPVIDADTGEKIGSVDVNHPNVLSGKWIHHSKNRKSVINTITGEREYIYKNDMQPYHLNNKKSQKGKENSNYIEINDDVINTIFSCLEKSITENHLILKNFINNLKQSFPQYKRISMVWIRNIFGDVENLLCQYNLRFKTNYQYNRFFRSTEQKEYLAKINLGKKRNKEINNDKN